MGFLFLHSSSIFHLASQTCTGLGARAGLLENLPWFFSLLPPGIGQRGTVSSVQVHRRVVSDSVGRGAFGSMHRSTCARALRGGWSACHSCRGMTLHLQFACQLDLLLAVPGQSHVKHQSRSLLVRTHPKSGSVAPSGVPNRRR